MHLIAGSTKKLPALTMSVKALMLAGALGLSPALSAAEADRMAFENQQMILQMFDELQRQIDELKQTTVRRDQFELLRTRVNQLGANVPVPIAPPAVSTARSADPTPVAYERSPAARTKNSLPELGSDSSDVTAAQSASLSQLFGYGSSGEAQAAGSQARSAAAQASRTPATNSSASTPAPTNIARASTPASSSSSTNQFTQAQAALSSNQQMRQPATSNPAPMAASSAQPAQITRVAAPDSNQASTYNPPIYNYGAAGSSVDNNQASRSSGVSQTQIEALSRQINALQRQQANLSAAGGNNQGLSTLKRDIAQLQRDQQQLASLENLPGQISLLNGLPAQVASLESLPGQFDQLQTQVDDLNGSLENSLFQLADIKNSTEARLNEIKSQMQLTDNFPTWMKWAMFGLGLLALIAGLTALLAASRQRKKINQLKDSLERDLLRVEDRIETTDLDGKPIDMGAFKEEIMALVATQLATSSAPKKSSAPGFLAATAPPSKDTKITTERGPNDSSPYNLSNAARKSTPQVKRTDEPLVAQTNQSDPSLTQTTDEKLKASASETLAGAAAGAATLSTLTKVSDDDLDEYLPVADEADEDITIMDFEDEDDAPSFSQSRSAFAQSGIADQAHSANDTSIDFPSTKVDDSASSSTKNDYDELDLSQEFSEAESEPAQSTDTLAMLSLLDHETKSERVKRDLTGQSASLKDSDIFDRIEPKEDSSPSLEEALSGMTTAPAPLAGEPATEDQTAAAEDKDQASSAIETPDQATTQSFDGEQGESEPLDSDEKSQSLSEQAATASTNSPRPARPKATQTPQTTFDETIARGRVSSTASSNPELASALFERAKQLTDAQQIQPALSDYNDLIKLFSTSQDPKIRAQVSEALLESTRLELTRTGTISAARLGQGKSFFSTEPKNRLFMESMELMRAAQRREVSSEIKDLKNVYQTGPELDFVGLEAWAQSLGGSAAERVQGALEQFKDWSSTQTS